MNSMKNRITAVLLTASLLICFGPGNAAGTDGEKLPVNLAARADAGTLSPDMEEAVTEAPKQPVKEVEALSEASEEQARETDEEGFFERVREKLSQAAGAVKDTAEKAADKVKETAGAAKDKAGSLLDAAGNQIGDMAGSLRDTAEDAAGAVKEKAQELSDAAAEKTQETRVQFERLAEKWRKVARYLGYRLEKTDITPEEWDLLEEKFTRAVHNAYRAGWIGKNSSLVQVKAEADFLFKSFKYAYRLGKKEIGPGEYALYMMKVVSRDGLPYGLAKLVEKLTGVNAEQLAAGAGELAGILADEIAAEGQQTG